jgi:peptidyl-dipeptidase Dcp
MKLTRLAAATVAVAFIASTVIVAAGGQPAGSRDNPLLAKSTLPYEAPVFDRITETDYAPALARAFEAHVSEIDAIANNPAPADFGNTVEALERSGELLTRVTRILMNVGQTDSTPGLEKIIGEAAPKLAAHRDTIYQNPRLFERVSAVHDQREKLDSQSQRLVERYYRNFVRLGARLNAADKAALRALNQEEATLTTQFGDRLRVASNSAAIVVEDRDQLDGLNDEQVAALAAAAQERGLEGKWVIALQNTTQHSLQASLKNRALRQRIHDASITRCLGGQYDTTAIVARLAQLRAEKARLLGFPTYAAYALDDQMAKTPANANKLMTDIVPAAVTKAREEAARMQKIIDAEGGGFTLAASDWDYYSELVRKADYDLDQKALQPYFPVDRVLYDGVFFSANKLFGLTFKERKDLPVYNPEVRAFEVFDADGRGLAILYIDLFARPSKRGGAWMDVFVEQNGLTGGRPVLVNVFNFTKPAPGRPTLLTWEDVTTLFHEFGHSLHGMLSNVKYPTLAGTNTPTDFVEFPSKFYEHFALEPSVLASYARHYQTNEPLPASLAEKIRRTTTFNEGRATTQYLASALLDMAWHELPADAPLQDVESFEKATLRRLGLDYPLVPPRYRTTYFGHIWGGGYSAGYYAYLWSGVLEFDTAQWFDENGGMTRANGQRYRDMVLSRGATEDAAAMYRAFRGRDPQVEPLLIGKGLMTSSPVRQ